MQLTEENIRRIARQEGSRSASNAVTNIMTGGQTVGNSRHATDADHATEADHAAKADHATDADHAAKAADLDENGSKKFLRKDQDDATEH